MTRSKAKRNAPKAVPPRGKISIGKKVLFAAFTGSSFFVLLEATLFLAGVEPVLYRDDPYVGFASTIPLFVESAGPDGRVEMVTARNKLQWFNAQRFPKDKERGTYRIFALGGSTTYGRPYDDTASFAGWLRELLPATDPSRRWEVINAGGISYASYRVALLMEELIRYQPDLFIVYSGHNEFLEERTYRDIIEAPQLVTATGSSVSRTRTYTMVKSVFEKTLGRAAEPRKERAILQSEVETLLDRSMGPSAYSRNDNLRARILDHYRFNLDRMVDLAHSAGAELIFVTPAMNLKDCSPFKSEHLDGMSNDERKRFDDLREQAKEARATGRLDEALELVSLAGAIDDRFAEIHYLKGQILYTLARYREARFALQRAVDEDICPLRALPEIQQIIAETGRRRGVPVIDFARSIQERSEHGIPGADYFLDHVHLTLEGYRLLAIDLLDVLHREGIANVAEDLDSQVEVVSRRVESRIDPEAHGIALRNLAKVFAWAGKFTEAEEMANRAADILEGDPESYNTLGLSAAAQGDPEAAISNYRHALAASPEFVDAHNNLGVALVSLERWSEAEEHFREAIRIDPRDTTAHVNLGDTARLQGRFDEAIRHYRHALDINGSDADTHSDLGISLMALGEVDDAISHLRRALQLRPSSAEALYNLGKALDDTGELDEAVQLYRRALQIRADHPEAHYNLGTLLGSRGQIDEAILHFRTALDAKPDFAQAHYNMANALLSQGKNDDAVFHLERAVRADPSYDEALTNLGFVYSSQGDYDRALAYFRRVLALRPEYGKAHYNVAGVLALRGRVEESARYYRVAVELEPEFADAHYGLGSVLASLGQAEEGLVHYRRAAQLAPDWPSPLRGIAWTLATHPNPSLRDPEEAVELAERAAAMTEFRDAIVLDTLAASYASAGRFERASETVTRALALTPGREGDLLRSEMQRRLALYERGTPYRQPAAAEAAAVSN